MRNSHSVPHS